MVECVVLNWYIDDSKTNDCIRVGVNDYCWCRDNDHCYMSGDQPEQWALTYSLIAKLTLSYLV